MLPRNLVDYANIDGLPPDGMDNDTDDSTALRAALNDGPGVVRIGPGFYRCGEITIPAQVTLVGAGRATAIRSNGAERLLIQQDVDGWCMRDLILEGEAEGDWRQLYYSSTCISITFLAIADPS